MSADATLQQPGNLGPPLLSARKTQERLDMCPSTIWKMERDGLIKGVNV
jgi:hypothetical protein